MLLIIYVHVLLLCFMMIKSELLFSLEFKFIEFHFIKCALNKHGKMTKIYSQLGRNLSLNHFLYNFYLMKPYVSVILLNISK